MENRKKMNISGVTDVDNFGEKSVLVYTEAGELLIGGRNLRVNAISVETGEMSIEGEICSVVYGDKDKKSPLSMFGKLFK
jgi:sporulation protein YabP